ncbi:MAG: hypothetical protein R3B45_09050 [Bdellovibrionota bacterium]
MNKQGHIHQKEEKNNIPMPERAVKNLADSIFKTLCDEGCNPKDIIGVSSQLLSLVTSELEKASIID